MRRPMAAWRGRPEEQSDSLEANLRRAAMALSKGEAPSSTDRELRECLLELYDEQDAGAVWERWLAPFIAAHEADLVALYGRNRQLPNPLLDELEALIVLERLDSAPTSLARSWPRSPIELERLAQNWAIAI
jgi:hypothetical protein